MKTLKEELQAILDEKKLNGHNLNRFICSHLSEKNRPRLSKHRPMSQNYAKDFVAHGLSWWQGANVSDKDYDFVISEKYRFIQDLIKILP